MRVRGDNAPSNAFTLEEQPKKPGFFLVRFYDPEICRKARAGQFVHVRIDRRGDHILRRPFSIHNTEPDGALSSRSIWSNVSTMCTA